MGAFPEDYEVRVCKLIQLWVAEGFLKLHDFEVLEEVAEEYLADLINRNLILAHKKGSNGKVKTFNTIQQRRLSINPNVVKDNEDIVSLRTFTPESRDINCLLAATSIAQHSVGTREYATVKASQVGLNFPALFSKLENLKLGFQSPSDFTSLRNINLPPSLKKISLNGCRIPWEFFSIFNSVPNLEVLKLHYAFIGPEWVPTEGELPKLKFLQIWGTNLVYWRAEDNHFPSLEHLVLRNCSKLVEIPSSIGEIPSLETIEMDDSSPSAVDSACQILEEQLNQGNDCLQLVVYPRRSEF
ncbi:putative late blight resistance protein homolog R1A-10 [Olea europaea var. sylvestris]|uniref:putative late blight resistance protein homolog R1A-10 n=1 Tax=Olea europaea var. sylvestris TaxID=158386 RepID=UPI000C1D0F88|nr:putative late blight resistance protein homolog R1A-10 [Olea europaea var. sylvestris]